MNKLKIGQIFRYPKDKVRDQIEIPRSSDTSLIVRKGRLFWFI